MWLMVLPSPYKRRMDRSLLLRRSDAVDKVCLVDALFLMDERLVQFVQSLESLVQLVRSWSADSASSHVQFVQPVQ